MRRNSANYLDITCSTIISVYAQTFKILLFFRVNIGTHKEHKGVYSKILNYVASNATLNNTFNFRSAPQTDKL